MAKRRTPPPDLFEPTVAARLRAIGRYEASADPSVADCEINFDRPPLPACGLHEFRMVWCLGSPKKVVPVPDDELFALWDRYLLQHVEACDDYRRWLFKLFSESDQAGYDDRQWRQLHRTRPTEADLRQVISHAGVSLYQYQPKGTLPREYKIIVDFGTFWADHGVELLLSEASGKFAVVKWSSIGDL